VDSLGNVYVTGSTVSSDFPTTAGAFQSALAGSADVFVSKLNRSGSALVYSTYLGGNNADHGFGVAVDAAGDAYVTGRTTSNDFPTTPGAFQTSLGGGAFDAFMTKLTCSGSALVYSTYLGGSGDDEGFGVAVDATSNNPHDGKTSLKKVRMHQIGDAFVTGTTISTNFPTTPGAFQTTLRGNAFVTKIGTLTLAGQPGAPNCHGVSVSSLVKQFGNMNAADSALGFCSVKELQDAIRAFCRG
jgi:Beta-propeller repeat